MKHWRVGLRVENGKWFASKLGSTGAVLIETKMGQTTAGDALNLLLRELEDWHTYCRVRYPN